MLEDYVSHGVDVLSLDQDTMSLPGAVQPRILLQSDGLELPVPERLQIRRSRMAEAGVFSAVLPVQDAGKFWFDPENGTGSVSVEAFLGFLPLGAGEGTASLTRVFSGIVDHVQYMPASAVVVVTGRDWSAKLIEHELSGSSFLNMTASEAITELATEVGLEADVDETEGLIGQFYQYEHKAHGLAGMHRYQTAWDFCVGLQHQYGYELWVDGKTVHFKMPEVSDDILTLTWQAPSTLGLHYPVGSVSDLTLSRRFMSTDGMSVTVSAWDARQRASHSATYPQKSGTARSQYSFSAPVGTTQDQCLMLAQQRFNDLVAHERTIHMHVHPEISISPRQKVRLQGTGTSFDSLLCTVDEVTLSVAAGHVSQAVTLRVRSGE